MDPIIEELLKDLPRNKANLSDDDRHKIHRYLPVPTDYKILWADILSMDGYPAGIVITDHGLIIKSTKDEVKKRNEEIKEKNKELDKKDQVNKLNGIYQIIPWEYYSPDDYNIVSKKVAKGSKRYYFNVGDTELAQFGSPSLFRFFTKCNSYIKEEQRKAEEVIESSTFSAINSYNVEGTLFNSTYGADTTKSGHGIYAEEAGSILDKLAGEQSTVVGRDNAKNGPDKIVDSIPIQCKYYKNARGSVNACFKPNGAGGKTFRYYDLMGNPMKIEVPSDQYFQAVDQMKNRIAEGSVPGVTDPNAAYDIIRKGKLSYKQALNLAKAGTVESISYDALTGAINCTAVFGITSVVAFAQVFWSTKDYKKAAKSALLAGLQVYGLSFVGGILASQLSRTGASNTLKPLATFLGEKLSPKFVSGVVNAFRVLAGKKAIYGAAAQKSFVKAFSSNMITEGVMFLVFSVPNTFGLISKRISGAQYVKEMLSLLASFGGTFVGNAVIGAMVGNVAGQINPKFGKALGMVAGTVIGGAAGAGAKAIGNIFHEDDSKVTTRLFNAVLSNLVIDYMLSEKEMDDLISVLNEKGKSKELHKLQKNLLKSDKQTKDITDFLSPLMGTIVSKREKIDKESEAELNKNVDEIVSKGDLRYDL